MIVDVGREYELVVYPGAPNSPALLRGFPFSRYFLYRFEAGKCSQIYPPGPAICVRKEKTELAAVVLVVSRR